MEQNQPDAALSPPSPRPVRWLVPTGLEAVAAAGALTAEDPLVRWCFVVIAAAVLVASWTPLASFVAMVAPMAIIGLGIASGRSIDEHYWDIVALAATSLIAVLAVRATTQYAAAAPAHAEALREQLTAEQLVDDVERAMHGEGGSSFVTREFARAQRYQRAMAVAIAEIDGLTALREQGGVTTAFEALRELSRLFGEDTRLPDGGISEDLRLIFVLPETPLLGARIVAERVRLSFQALQVAGPDGSPLTVSIGVAAFPDDGRRSQDVIATATRALERALAGGGNRTVISRSPSGTPIGWSSGGAA